MGAITNLAFSFTLSGNSGISPFLTMLLIGVTQRIDPTLFDMSETMHKIMSSWPSIVIWGTLTVLEYVAKCIPAVDTVMDSIDVFLVPILSTLGTFSTFGSYNYGNNDSNNGDSPNDTNFNNDFDSLEAPPPSVHTFALITQILIILGGIFIALSLHFFKMLLRIMGMGCFTACLTVMEFMTVIVGVLVSVFVRQFSIFVATCFIVMSGYNAYKRWKKRQQEESGNESNNHRQQQQQTRSLLSSIDEEGGNNASNADNNGLTSPADDKNDVSQPILISSDYVRVIDNDDNNINVGNPS